MMTQKRRLILITIIFCLFSIIVTQSVFAGRKNHKHRDHPVPVQPLYNKSYNRIHNTGIGLDIFCGKLEALRKNRGGSVTILHIGDSHIQADFLTAIVRGRLQETFGNAGRGLMFPYRVARTNGPLDYRSDSDAVWRSERNASRTVSVPMGISGFAIETKTEGAGIRLFFKHIDKYSFDRGIILHDCGARAFPFSVSDRDAESVVHEDASPYGTTFLLSSLTDSITITTSRTDSNQNYGILYGVSVENGKAGILYHMAGVNGATFKNFNDSEYLTAHLKALKPDLVIISLGANDSVGKNFSLQDISHQVQSLAASIKRACPDSDILFTIPPNFGNPRKGRLAQNILLVRKAIITCATEKGHAFWDLYNVMGGKGSFVKWRKSGLAQGDMVHFTKTGYELQGNLFTDALIEAFAAYTSH